MRGRELTSESTQARVERRASQNRKVGLARLAELRQTNREESGARAESIETATEHKRQAEESGEGAAVTLSHNLVLSHVIDPETGSNSPSASLAIAASASNIVKSGETTSDPTVFYRG